MCVRHGSAAAPEALGAVAVVLPGASLFPLAHFGVVPLKRVAMIQVARKKWSPPNLKSGSEDGEQLSLRR